MNHQPYRTEELQQPSFLIVLSVVSLAMAWIVWPYSQPLLWAALTAIMFQPLYRTILRRTNGKRNQAAGLSLLVIFFVLMVPALLIGAMVVEQALLLITTIQERPVDITEMFDQVRDSLPAFARDALDRSGWGNMALVQARLQQLLSQSAGLIANQALSIGSGALSFVLSFGVALYIMYFLLRDGERIGRTILRAVPIEQAIAQRLLDRFLSIVRATIKGTGVVALVQGALGTIALMIAGVPSALLFGVIMAIFSLIPVVGSGAVWLPAGVWLLATGAIWQGVFMLLFGFFAIASVDNVLRPILVGRDTGIPDWIILVTTLGGISLIGFSGIVLGPVVAGLFLASWSILRKQQEEDEVAARPETTLVDPSGNLLGAADPEAG